MSKKQKILIYRLGSLGDTIMALPCFHLIRDKYPDADITLLTNKPVASKAAPLAAILGEESYFFDRIINYPIGTRNPFVLLQVIAKIRALRINTMVNLSAARSRESSRRDKLFFRVAGVKEMFGFPEIDEDFTVSVTPATGEYEWEATRLTRRLEKLGQINLSANRYWDLMLHESETETAASWLQGVSYTSRIISICAGTKMQSKDWGIDNWCSLIKNLSQKLTDDWTLVMVGAQDEFGLSEMCLEAWGGKGLNLCGKISPRVSAAVLSKAELFIGHDSGPMHLAGCVGTPSIAVFSARNRPRQWFPRGDFNQIIYHKTDCAGCRLETCIEQKKKCILSITVEEVEAAVNAKLEIIESKRMFGFGSKRTHN